MQVEAIEEQQHLAQAIEDITKDIPKSFLFKFFPTFSGSLGITELEFVNIIKSSLTTKECSCKNCARGSE